MIFELLFAFVVGYFLVWLMYNMTLNGTVHYPTIEILLDSIVNEKTPVKESAEIDFLKKSISQSSGSYYSDSGYVSPTFIPVDSGSYGGFDGGSSCSCDSGSCCCCDGGGGV